MVDGLLSAFTLLGTPVLAAAFAALLTFEFALLLRVLVPSTLADPDQPVLSRDTRADLVLGIVALPIVAVARHALSTPMVAALVSSHFGGLEWWWSLRQTLGAWHPAAQFLFVVVVSDFILYWAHRLQHVGFFWRFHVVHHSAKTLDWSTTMRKHPGDVLAPFLPFVLLSATVSDTATQFLSYQIFAGAHQMLLHLNINWGFGPLRYVIVSPLHHRWHHSEEAGRGHNFAVFLSIWDYAFGTAHVPADRLPKVFGVDQETPVGPGALLVYPFLPAAGEPGRS